MDILFYGSHYWDRGPWFRKQYFAKFLAERNHRVFYIENSVSMVKWKPGVKNNLFRTKLSNPMDNLYVITPSAFFPFPHNYFIRSIYNIKLWRDIRKIFRVMNVQEYVLWFNIIAFSTVLNKLKPKKIIFDLSDDVPFFFKLSNNENRYKTYMRFMKISYDKADIPIVTAQKIKEKYQCLSEKEIMVIPNGYNFPSVQTDPLEIPFELKDKSKPIIGFIGTLFRFTDDELLEYIISQRKNYNYVFVGAVQKEFPLEKITKYPNAFILGEKKKEEIGKYINAFDICINPFKKHEVNDSVSPLKVFEYIAFRKPIVSTPMYSLQHESISQYINFSDSSREFLNAIDQIVERQSYNNNVPEQALLDYKWENLFEKLIRNMKVNYNFEL